MFKTNIAFGRVFIISMQELHSSSKNELSILTELFKNVTCRYLFIMTVTIKIWEKNLGEVKIKSLEKKVSFENCWSLLPSFASLPTTNEKELFPLIPTLAAKWRLTSCELQTNKFQFYKIAKQQLASCEPITLKVTSYKPTNLRIENLQNNDW